VEFFNQIEHVRSNSIYKHDTTLKMAFGATFFADFNTESPIVGHNRVSNKKPGLDRRLGGTRHPCRNMISRLGVARLTTGTWQVGDAGARKWRQ
jgi:hypothetical protein